MVRAALDAWRSGGVVIDMIPVTVFRGSGHPIDHSTARGAITAPTCSLALALEDEGIRVNAVAPGRIRAPLIPATFSAAQR